MHHQFDCDLAVRYGVLEALLIGNIEFWIAKNEANGVHFHDGRYWTYNSSKAFAALFPYFSERSVYSALRHLIKEGILITGHYGNKSCDRTLWYSFSDFGKSILQNCKMDYAKNENGNCNFAKSTITDIKNADNKPDNKKIDSIIAYLNAKTGKAFRATTRKTAALIGARLREGFTSDDCLRVIDTKAAEWLGDPKMEAYLRPETLFGTKFESYLNQKSNDGKAEKSYNTEDFFKAAVEKGRKNERNSK